MITNTIYDLCLFSQLAGTYNYRQLQLIRKQMRSLATIPNKHLVVIDKVGTWNTPGEFGVSKSVNCDLFLFSALTLLSGRQERLPACKKLGVGLLVVANGPELCMSRSSSCHHHLRHPYLQ